MGPRIGRIADGSERAVIVVHCRHRVAWTEPAVKIRWLAVHMAPHPPAV